MKKRIISIILISAAAATLWGCTATMATRPSSSNASTDTSTATRPVDESSASSASEESETSLQSEETETSLSSGYTDSMNSASTNNNTNTGANSNSSSETIISDSEAKSIALSDAGISEDEVDFIHVYLEYDHGIRLYNVEFYANGVEYDYEIHAVSGTILEMDSEIEHGFYNQQGTSSAAITIEEAKALALERVSGADESDIYIKRDHDDGRTIYEGSIFYNGYEYEFEIDAATGSFLSWEKERFD